MNVTITDVDDGEGHSWQLRFECAVEHLHVEFVVEAPFLLTAATWRQLATGAPGSMCSCG